MASIRATLRTTRDRLVGPVAFRVADQVAPRVASETVNEMSGQLSQQMLAETAEIRRILGNQGDAADEVAETLGRALTRLSAEVSSLTAELARLNERLDLLEKH